MENPGREVEKTPKKTSPHIFIIMRVFNLGSVRPCMRIYVDPPDCDVTGPLKFKPAEWSVTPKVD
jgi:hypothetical protein